VTAAIAKLRCRGPTDVPVVRIMANSSDFGGSAAFPGLEALKDYSCYAHTEAGSDHVARQ
jgi:hypothetical protein